MTQPQALTAGKKSRGDEDDHNNDLSHTPKSQQVILLCTDRGRCIDAEMAQDPSFGILAAAVWRTKYVIVGPRDNWPGRASPYQIFWGDI